MVAHKCHWFSKTTVLVALALMLVLSTTSVRGVRYIVGDSVWSIPPTQTFYDDWSSSHTFYEGDELYFDFESEMYNVVQAQAYKYQYCESDWPIKVYEDGPVVVRVEPTASRQSHIQFLSSKLDHHCSIGLKFTVWINESTPSAQDNILGGTD